MGPTQGNLCITEKPKASGREPMPMPLRVPMNEAQTLSLPPSTNLSMRPATPTGISNPGARTTYLALLTWAFTLFNTLRLVAYLPTMWAICASGDSSQHSLWTWCTWLGANATMAAWLYEQTGQRLSRAAVINIGNAAMCAVTVVLIVAHRGWFS